VVQMTKLEYVTMVSSGAMCKGKVRDLEGAPSVVSHCSMLF
jgi:hypothetical protein